MTTQAPTKNLSYTILTSIFLLAYATTTGFGIYTMIGFFNYSFPYLIFGITILLFIIKAFFAIRKSTKKIPKNPENKNFQAVIGLFFIFMGPGLDLLAVFATDDPAHDKTIPYILYYLSVLIMGSGIFFSLNYLTGAILKLIRSLAFKKNLS